MATRAVIVEKVLEAKTAQGLTWKAIAERVSGGSPVYTTAALLGQMTLSREEADKAAALFDFTPEEATLLTEPPFRGSIGHLPPSDPLIYRFYELLNVYGTTWKALINEEFGDGIMSAIDFNMQIEREADPKGDRVKLTLSGKFLPYKRY